MRLDLDVTGRRVVVFGTAAGARRALRRYQAEGAKVIGVLDEAPLPGREPPVKFKAMPAHDDQAGLLALIGPAWLVVLVDPPIALRGRIAALARSLSVLLVCEQPAEDRGSVTLVGGGPGQAGLLTLDARDALRDADVVFYDRLSPTSSWAASPRLPSSSTWARLRTTIQSLRSASSGSWSTGRPAV